MSLIKRIDDFAKAVGKEIRETNKRVEELAVRVLINLRNETPFKIGGHQLILLDSEMKPHSITSSNNPYKERERYRGGFSLDHIYFYDGDSVNPFAGFKRKELYSRHPRVDFKLSSNCGDFLEPNKPVYLVIGYDEETNAHYLATKWWTQKLPTEEDGLIYKHIGFARMKSHIQFFNDGKTYQFKGGSVLSGDSAGNIVIVDDEVTEESMNPVTSQAVVKVVDDLKQEVKQEFQEANNELDERTVTLETIVGSASTEEAPATGLIADIEEAKGKLENLDEMINHKIIDYVNEVFAVGYSDAIIPEDLLPTEGKDSDENQNP